MMFPAPYYEVDSQSSDASEDWRRFRRLQPVAFAPSQRSSSSSVRLVLPLPAVPGDGTDASEDGRHFRPQQPVPVAPSSSSSCPSRQSLSSANSRVSGPLGGGVEKGWIVRRVIEERKYCRGYDAEVGESSPPSRACRLALGVGALALVFAAFCLVVWGASRPYEADVVVESVAMEEFYVGEGTDYSGVGTKLATVNCLLTITVYNPAPTFGIRLVSSPINLLYMEIPIATGQLQEYDQPRKSQRTAAVILRGDMVPLYGAGAGLDLPQSGGVVSLRLDFNTTATGKVMGGLVRTTHRKHISCAVALDPTTSRPVKFLSGSCAYS